MGNVSRPVQDSMIGRVAAPGNGDFSLAVISA